MSPLQTDGQVRFHPPLGESVWPPVASWTFTHWKCFLNQHGWADDQAEQYYYRDRFTYGFGARRNPKEPWKWFYLPIPRAVEFHASKTPNILYGGAVGGAKSTAARWDAYRHCWVTPEFTAIIMRRTHQELKRNHMKFVAREAHAINKFLGREVMEWVPTEFELRFRHNNSILLFGHCQNAGDEEKYLSDEYDAFYPDEVATFLKEQIFGVASRLRSTKPGVIPRLGCTSNPGGAHTLWCKEYFIDRNLSELESAENPRYVADEWAYIKSQLYDNPYLMDPDGTFTTYENRLFVRGERRARQLLEGDWSVITGQYFAELTDTHFDKLEIPPGTRIERWIDWGYNSPGVCLWAALLPSGRLYVFHEYVFRNTIASQVATTIAKETRDIINKYRVRLSSSICDPAMAGTDGQTGESYLETFSRFGVHCIEGDNQRVLGWGRLRHWLAIAPDNLPWMIIDPRCSYTKRTLPTLVIAKNDPEDLNTDGEDHAADAIRYGVMARPTPTRLITSVHSLLPDSVRSLLNSLQVTKERKFGQVV